MKCHTFSVHFRFTMFSPSRCFELPMCSLSLASPSGPAINYSWCCRSISGAFSHHLLWHACVVYVRFQFPCGELSTAASPSWIFWSFNRTYHSRNGSGWIFFWGKSHGFFCQGLAPMIWSERIVKSSDFKKLRSGLQIDNLEMLCFLTPFSTHFLGAFFEPGNSFSAWDLATDDPRLPIFPRIYVAAMTCVRCEPGIFVGCQHVVF